MRTSSRGRKEVGRYPRSRGYISSLLFCEIKTAFMLVHGRLGWSYGADLDQTPSKDEALDDISPYWLTNTTISPARRYWENRNVNLISAAAQDTDRIRIPMAITAFPHDDLYRPPETWARRAFPGLVYFSEAGRGVHFPAWEEPALFAAEMRAAFEPLPSAG